MFFLLAYDSSDMCVRVTWSDDYVLGLFNHVNSLIHIDLCVCACDLHGLSCAGG